GDDKLTDGSYQRINNVTSRAHARWRLGNTVQARSGMGSTNEASSDGYKNTYCNCKLQWARRKRRDHVV
ncbi:hypothetical protein HPB47_012707, partial [Ixodes persulcatus]